MHLSQFYLEVRAVQAGRASGEASFRFPRCFGRGSRAAGRGVAYTVHFLARRQRRKLSAVM
jgi:hypothetical protein